MSELGAWKGGGAGGLRTMGISPARAGAILVLVAIVVGVVGYLALATATSSSAAHTSSCTPASACAHAGSSGQIAHPGFGASSAGRDLGSALHALHPR